MFCYGKAAYLHQCKAMPLIPWVLVSLWIIKCCYTAAYTFLIYCRPDLYAYTSQNFIDYYWVVRGLLSFQPLKVKIEDNIACITMWRRKQKKITVGTVHGLSHLNAMILPLFLHLVFLFDMGQSLNFANSLLLLFCRVYITLNAFNDSSAFHKLALSVFSL